jgi:hypothetical protein
VQWWNFGLSPIVGNIFINADGAASLLKEEVPDVMKLSNWTTKSLRQG